MIKKLILTTVLVVQIAHGSQTETLYTEPQAKMNQTVKYDAWNPTIAEKEAGESCDDGNCLSDLGCLTKDGPAYKLMASIRDEIKRQCKKL
ncbi:MAG: Unknown protein [uncultured Sulfurovum sp.]|uniref:Uncharacterized protein n=1 Tax=uncultured Sulfurovum sp. TaxID=269237 RepID=A0A6S6U3J6_9BACT|nr:MAG: Unknown protein [uncultured Sulfurovum sp.]